MDKDQKEKEFFNKEELEELNQTPELEEEKDFYNKKFTPEEVDKALNVNPDEFKQEREERDTKLNQDLKKALEDLDKKLEESQKLSMNESKIGEDLIYDENDKIQERNFYSNDIQNGECRIYKDGMLVEKKNYKDGKLNGSFEQYENGILTLMLKYQNNLIEDRAYFFLEGKLNAIAFYIQGKLNGPFLLFNENGSLVKNQNYKDDVLEGRAITYYESGFIFEEGEYFEGQKHGKWIQKFENGNNLAIEIYYKGILQSKKKMT